MSFQPLLSRSSRDKQAPKNGPVARPKNSRRPGGAAASQTHKHAALQSSLPPRPLRPKANRGSLQAVTAGPQESTRRPWATTSDHANHLPSKPSLQQQRPTPQRGHERHRQVPTKSSRSPNPLEPCGQVRKRQNRRQTPLPRLLR